MITKMINQNSAVGKCLQIYKNLDNYTLSCHATCKQGCCSCCYDYFYISEAEFYTILFYLYQNKNFTELLKFFSLKAHELSMQLKKYIPAEFNKIYNDDGTIKPIEYYLLPALDGLIRLKNPCIFLDGNGKCIVYDSRPIICRKFGTVIDRNLGEESICENVKYSHNMDFSNYENSREIDFSIFIAGNSFRKPYPILYWFDEFLSILHINKFTKFHQAYAQNYEDFVSK